MFRKALLLGGLILGVMVYGAFAADRTWTGTISDSMCGAKHMAGAEHGSKMSDAECTNGVCQVICVNGQVFSNGCPW